MVNRPITFDTHIRTKLFAGMQHRVEPYVLTFHVYLAFAYAVFVEVGWFDWFGHFSPLVFQVFPLQTF